MMTRDRRQDLLLQARETCAQLDEADARQAAAALAVLQRQGLEKLRRALGKDVRVLTGASAPHWERFASVARFSLDRLSGDSAREEAAFFLGWVKRLARVKAGGSVAVASLLSATVGLPKAGQTVEVELLEERTKKGGWRARHPGSGLSGPVHNSADVPDSARPGQRLQMVVASVTPTEMAFRYSRPEQLAGDASRPSRGRKKKP